jgi:phosphoribosylanthranilate isomerase
VVKAIPVGDRFDEASAEAWPERVTLLLDVDDPVRRGGTGRTIDWGQVAGLARRRRVLVAGGLTPENVAEAIAAAQPFGIDVSSGVETRPGLKDHGRMGALFDAISGALPRTTGSRCAATALMPPALGAGNRRETDR